jgi:beta-glucosidase
MIDKPLTRRTVLAGTAATLLSLPAAAQPRLTFPAGFLWGAATAGHQSEGNNVNSDMWLLEHVQPTALPVPSGDASNSLFRHEEDIALAARVGLNCYRFSIEWSRIEPEEGLFSLAMLDYYARLLEACRGHGLRPMVTLNHFSVPRWFAAKGGFTVAGSSDRFVRFVDRAARRFGDLLAYAITFNEPQVTWHAKWSDPDGKYRAHHALMLAAAAKASGSTTFSAINFTDPDQTEPELLAAHAKAYQALKSAASRVPVGATIALVDEQGVGEGNRAAEKRRTLYDAWLTAPGDFAGVQTYGRQLVGRDGNLGHPEGAEMTLGGIEYYPKAIGGALRYAARVSGKPLIVTENGIATDNDARRIDYIDEALAEMHRCIAEGIDVRGYIYWSLVDSWEWAAGFRPTFGLVAVDRQTFKRTPRQSAWHLGAIARANALPRAKG